MRPALIALAAAFLLGGVWTATAVGSSTDGRGRYLDDDGSVHEEDINGLGASGVTQGCNPPASTDFCPNRSVTRAEMASFLVRALDLPAGPGNRFSDTSPSVHANAIDALAAARITLGCNPPANDRYCPERSIDRAEMATFLVRGLQLASSDDHPFSDTANSVHGEAIDALAAADITLGCNPPTNDLYCPERFVSRGEMASFLVRALDDIDPEANTLSLRHGLTCTKDGTSCSARISLAAGTRVEISEGWYQALPYLDGEQAEFTGNDTYFGAALNGSTLATTPSDVATEADLATRVWHASTPRFTTGTHTLTGTWVWDGSKSRSVTYVITVNG